MWKSQNLLLFLVVFGAAALAGCKDYLTGQEEEPGGPLLLERLTLLDSTSRDHPVFSDSSIPECGTEASPKNPDHPSCKSDVNRDKWSLAKSPPTPYSVEIRAVFNKIPLYLNGKKVEEVDPPPPRTDQSAAVLTCSGCAMAPPVEVSLYVSGSDTSSDPTHDIHYGPGFLLKVVPNKTTHEFAALEPDTSYEVTLNPGLADRRMVRLALDERQRGLLRFKTEPFIVLRAGNGDPAAKDWVYEEKSAAPVYTVKALANDGALVVTLNAPLHEDSLAGANPVATVGDTTMVDVDLATNVLIEKKDAMGVPKKECDKLKRRVLLIVPRSGSWAPADGTPRPLKVTISAAGVKDVSQAAGHPVGRHQLGHDIVINATLTGKAADASYKGRKAADVSQSAMCPT